MESVKLWNVRFSVAVDITAPDDAHTGVSFLTQGFSKPLVYMK